MAYQFQNERQAGSSDASGSTDSSIITLEKRHDHSIEYWNTTPS
jgi:hypothetical protein